MATRTELLDNIELLVTGGRPTDEDRFWIDQALFLLNIESARAIYEEALERIKIEQNRPGYSWDPQLASRVDPGLLQTETLEVVPQGNERWGIATLPAPPLPLPESFGIISVFSRKPSTGTPITIQPGTTSTVRARTGTIFSQPVWIRAGQELELYGFRGQPLPGKIQVRMVGYGQRPEGVSQEWFLNQQFPLPDHLASMVTQRVVELLRSQVAMPGDSYNDNRDQSATSQPS